MRRPEFGFEPRGSLYQITGDYRRTRIDRNLYIPNGIAFSPDGNTIYWADTFKDRRQIWKARYDSATGLVAERERFVHLAEQAGRPDGAAMDADGCYWVAAVWGWQLLRYRPDGTLDLAVRLPVQRPSKLAFGGSNLDTIFFTTIKDGFTEDVLRSQPLAGHLLAINIGIQGLPCSLFRW